MHNIEYFTYPENVDRQGVEKKLDNYVAHEDWQEGCCGLYHPIRWLKDKVYANYVEAHEAVEKLDGGDYDNLAVKYYVYHQQNDDKLKLLKQKVSEAYDEYDRRYKILYSDQVTSAYIGCKNCGSRLARPYLKSNSCPVCRAEMRPEYMLKSVSSAKNKWERAQREAKEYTEKKCKKEIVWLVKIESHT